MLKKTIAAAITTLAVLVLFAAPVSADICIPANPPLICIS